MTRLNCILGSALVFLAAASLSAQQVGTPNRNYTINNNGSGAASYVTTTVAVGSNVTNQYSTLDPNRPVAWAASTMGSMGWYQTATNSVDIGPAMIFLGNGADPFDPFSSLFRTNASGNLSFSVPAVSSLAPSSYYFAMAHQAPTSPEGLWVSQTHLVTFISDPNLSTGSPTCSTAAIPQSLGDDASMLVALGYTFPFYGTSYTGLYINSNGNVTFGAGDTSYLESVAALLSGAPRIAGWWDDLNPSVGGTISFSTDNSSIAEVCFSGVPEYNTTGAGVTFKITLVSGSFIAIDYGMISALDGIVGLSPGGGLATSLPLNLSLGPNVIAPMRAPHELFLTGTDLANLQVTFLLDSAGNPGMQL